MSKFSATIGFSALISSLLGRGRLLLSVSRGKVEVGKVGGEEGEGLIAGSRASDPFVNGRGGIVINLAASFAPFDGDETMARWDFLYFFIHSVI